MTAFRVIEAKPWHAGQMARRLRHEHQRAIWTIGMDAHRELSLIFDQSSFRRAWTVDGRLAGLGGVTGTLMSPFGYLWLALTEEATRYPFAIVREARRQLAIIMQTKRELATTLLSDDDAALRLAVFLGFHRSHGGPGERAYSRDGRRSLKMFLKGSPEARVPIGSGFALAVGYHEEEAA